MKTLVAKFTGVFLWIPFLKTSILHQPLAEVLSKKPHESLLEGQPSNTLKNHTPDATTVARHYCYINQ